MNTEQRAIVNQALGEYGSYLTPVDHIVNRTGRILDVAVRVKGTRLRFEGRDSKMIASGPITVEFVCSFVERFWYWNKGN